MTNVFKEQVAFIDQIENYLAGLTPEKIDLLLNKEYFYQAKHELPQLTETHPQQLHEILANKVFDQLTQKTEYDQIVDQLQHRLRVIQSKEFDQKEQCRQLFRKQREQIRKSNAKLNDFLPLYNEQVEQANSLDDPLTNQTIRYFQGNNKDTPLQEALQYLIESLDTPSPPAVEAHSETLDESTRAELDQILEQLKLVQNVFNFQ